MEHLNEEIANLITQLSEANFNLLVKNFNKEYYKSREVLISNGPYDGGIDMEIRTDRVILRKNIQITIQKTKLKEKIESDVAKAKENVDVFDYQSTLEFYYSQPISPQKQREFKRNAKINYDINLEIFDSSYFGEVSNEYESIKKTVYEIYSFPVENEIVPVTKQTKVLFDLLAIGKNTGELQRQFIHSLIFTYLYEHPDCSELELIENIGKQISGDGDAGSLIKGQVSSLRMKGQILSGTDKGKLVLAEEKIKKLDDILNITNAQEALLKIEIETLLSPYDLRAYARELVDYIYQTFQENYNADLEELTKGTNHYSSSLKRIYSALINFINQKIGNEANSQKIANELLTICTNNEFLNKISASILFTKLYQSDKLDAYVNNREMELLIDTQILLRLICLQYENFDFDDSPFQNVKIFYDTISEYRGKVIIKTTSDYIDEVAGHIQEALKLERFMSLAIFEDKRMKSKNVFFNYFNALNDKFQQDKEFGLYDFFDDLLGIETPNIDDLMFRKVVSETLEQIFEYMNIEIIRHERYQNYDSVRRQYELIMMATDKIRSYNARGNDLRTIIYLSTKELHIRNGIINEAFLITWDTLFYKIRKGILEKIKPYSYWYIYTPSKIADRISLMNFKLSPAAINHNIVSITESNFNLSSTTVSFIDLMSALFSKEDLSEIKLAQRLIQLENKNKPHSEVPIVEDVHQDSNPIAEILLDLRHYYSTPARKFNLQDLIELFQNNDEFEKVDKIIVENEEFYNQNNKIKEDIFQKFDQLISSIKDIN